MGFILDCLGNVKVENSSNSIIRAPDANTTKTLVWVKDSEVKIPNVYMITIIRNCDIIKTRKHDAPKNRIFKRIIKLILQVIAITGKKIRNRSCVYMGGLISFLILPTEIRPLKYIDGILK